MRALDHQLLAVNGINLSLYSAGPADGRPLWLLHGFPECWLSWRHQLEPLLAAGYQVFIVEEAVGSRTEQNRQLALLRLQQAGAQIISKEMLAFEWLDKAGTDNFRTISKGWIR